MPTLPVSIRTRAPEPIEQSQLRALQVCGFRFDCRNAIFLPRARIAEFHESPMLDLAAATGRLLAVNATSLGALSAARKFAQFGDFKSPRVHRMFGEGNPNFEAVAAAHRAKDIMAPFLPTRMIWPEALPPMTNR